MVSIGNCKNMAHGMELSFSMLNNRFDFGCYKTILVEFPQFMFELSKMNQIRGLLEPDKSSTGL